jgi:glycosyltransferase involved in cell wall biosynthesis
VKDIFTFPDIRNGWIPYGVRATRDLIRKWQPDLIFASAPHYSALLIAHVVAKKHHIPLVCELRDRWWNDPYYPPTAVKTFLAKRCEARILGNARAITTVSEPWAAVYRERYEKPVAVIYNGYDHANIAAEISNPFDDAKLNILYTGHIYVGYRDPSPLFAAVASDPALAGSVRLWFYGTDPQYLEALVSQYHLDETVMVNPSVPHAEAIALQRKADVLLLMQWNDPRDEGHIPAKLFEYLGSRRPILLLGLEGGVPDTILRERGAGQLCNSPEALAEQLRSWLAIKAANGAIPDVDPSARAGFSRREQYEKLRIFLEDLCAEV